MALCKEARGSQIDIVHDSLIGRMQKHDPGNVEEFHNVTDKQCGESHVSWAGASDADCINESIYFLGCHKTLDYILLQGPLITTIAFSLSLRF